MAAIPWTSLINLVSSVTTGSIGIASADATATAKEATTDAAYEAQAEKQKTQIAAQDQAQVMIDEAANMETPTEKYFMGRPESETA